MKPLIPLTLFLSCAVPALGTTFTVTSNADSGPGSFRDALQQAAANGTTATDIIEFNIADHSRAGRTITLASALPALTSNLTIDGTTQPGAPFGIGAARVIITNPFSQQAVDYFLMMGVSNIQIYGLYLKGVAARYAFYFRESANLTFGAAGKGNIIQGFGVAVQCDLISGADAGSNNITIQGNIMGTDESGTVANPGELNQNGLYFRNVSNLQIGGLNAGEGNLMNVQSIPMDYTDTRDVDFGYLNWQGNTEGTDVSGTIRLSPLYEAIDINGYNTGDANTTGTTRLLVNITNNVSACGYDLFDIASPFVIQGNHIGVGPDNTSNVINDGYNGSQAGIWLSSCGKGLIGGTDPSTKNYIANFIEFGVYEFLCGPITVSRNSIFCNGMGIEPDNPTNGHAGAFVNITLLTAGLVGGNALPNSTIELFYDDECPGCEGKTYIGTTSADSKGNWSYALTATGAIVATATDAYGATSSFSTATLNSDSVVVRNATCGRNNGSIRDMKVSSGTEWYWKDAVGNIVSHDTDLINVAPGTYTFETSIGGASCAASSTPYTITNVDPPAVSPGDITTTQPRCGQPNGALQDGEVFDATATYVWLKGGAEVCPDFTSINPFKNLSSGSYTLQVALKQDPNCFMQYGPYVLTNQSGPTLDTSRVIITPATCSLANGSISGLTWQNATGTVNLYWEDSTGLQLGYNPDLRNISGGPYRLSFADGSGCPAILTTWYHVPNLGTIASDTSKMVITPSNCGLPNGAISGIMTANATTFAWTVAGGGTIAANTVDISGLAAGTYLLTMSNPYGCQAETQPIIVLLTPKPAFDYSKLQNLNDTCNSGNGAITELAMVDPSRTYTWDWSDAGQPAGNTIGSTADRMDSLKAGTYLATVTDASGCSVTSEPFTIRDIEYAPDAPLVTDQIVPRNSSATIIVGNPRTGTYELLDNNMPGATVLMTSTNAVLQSPPVPQDETLYVEFIRGDCSSAISPVNIKVFDSVKLYAPNAFTPNNGANSRWRVISSGPVRTIHISIFNRYGQEVFASGNLNESWDGTTAGHPSSGTFAYVITGTDYYDRPFHLTGTLIVIR